MSQKKKKFSCILNYLNKYITRRYLPMRKDAIYARQSVDKKDSVSIETQIEKCEVIADKDSLIP